MRRELAVCLLLVLATLAVYGQVVHHDFVNLDDNEYVYENLHVRSGLTWKEIPWAFASMHGGNWHPLTWLSHMFVCELFGLDAGVHHLVNLLLHLLNSVLLYLVLDRMTGAVWRSAMVAALFALHPLHVESVAWVSERKDVLSTLFFMLTLGAYVRYANRPSRVRYGMVFGFLTLGLMSKPMLVTLPFLFLLLDYWPLDRFRFMNKAAPDRAEHIPQKGGEDRGRTAFQLLGEKVPLFILAGASCVVTFMAQQRAGAMALTYGVPFSGRVANALVAYVAYIGKTLWPRPLAIFYPYRDAVPTEQWASAGLFLVGISILVVWASRRWRYLVVGWFWYLGTLVPVIGLVQVGMQAMADRYTYLPLIGLFLMAVWGAADLAARWRFGRLGLAGSAAVVLLGCMAGAWSQIGHWQSGRTLYEHALKVTKASALVHHNLGVVLEQEGKSDEAILHFREALRIDPGYYLAHNSLGYCLEAQGNLQEAWMHYQKALQINPEYDLVHNNLGTLLARQGRTDEAMDHYRKALQIDPEYADVYHNLGVLLARQAKHDEAIAYYRQALQIHPEYADAINSLGASLEAQGKLEEAFRYFKEALRINPEHGQAHSNLAVVLARQGELDEAIVHLREALRINPENADAKHNLDVLLAR